MLVHRCSSTRSQSRSRRFPICRYHYKFGDRAKKCAQPCDYRTTGNARTSQKWRPVIGRLFVTDARTKIRFFVDTSSYLCFFPRSAAPVTCDLLCPTGSMIVSFFKRDMKIIYLQHWRMLINDMNMNKRQRNYHNLFSICFAVVGIVIIFFIDVD